MLFGRRVKLEGKYLDQQILKGNNDLRKREEYLKKSILRLEKDLDDIKDTFGKESAKKQELKEELRELNMEYVEVGNNYNDIHISIKAKQKHLDSIMNAINGHNLKFEGIERRCDDESKRLEELKSQIMSKEALKITMNEKYKDLEKSINILTKEEENLELTFKKESIKNSHSIVSKKNKIEDINKQIVRVENILEGLKDEGVILAEKNKTIDNELKEKIRDCDKAIEEKESSVYTGIKERSEKLRKLTKSIDKSQRILFDLEARIDDAKLNGVQYGI